MALLFHCGCGKRLQAREDLAGRRTRCPSCGAVLSIPSLSGPETDVSPAPLPRPAAGPSPGSPGRDEDEDEDDGDGDGIYGLADNPAVPRDSDLPEAPTGAAGPSTWHASAPDRAAPRRRPAKATSMALPPEAPGGSPREYLYLALALALVPLGVSLLTGGGETVPERLRRTMGKAGPEVVARVEQVFKANESAGLEDLLAALPGGRLDEDAHLPRQTVRHWAYGALAALAFWAFIAGLFPAEPKKPGQLLLIGLFTGTLGIVMLLGFQYLAAATQGVWLRGRNPLVLLFYLAKFIGFSYASANDPDTDFLLSLVGFTFGVGLCEEICKALPIVVHFRLDPRLGWRGACVWGLASGVGFGVSEGIMYSANHYNGISTAGIYLVRFVSCVVLHALWSGSVGITVWRRQETIQSTDDWGGYGLALLRILAVPMTLHGLYDTLLKKDMDAYALAVGLASFAWFAFQVESARKADSDSDSVHKGWAAA